MIFEQFYLGCLAHASYLIGSEGLAAVVDPQRDVDIYLETARQHGLRIAHIIETHLHADFVSGHQELAQRTGATIYLGDGSGATFEHRAVHDGDMVEFGNVRLRFLQTPGHTLESVSVVVTDLERGPEPAAVLTGDTLFIGDVGRPDLSESHTPQQLARLLYDSLHRKLLALPDNVAVYPAHGAGSMCGRNISADRSSTIGRERAANYALQSMTPEQFVELMTHDLPARPEYFLRDADVNRHGAAALDSLPPLASLSPAEVQWRQHEGAAVLDTRAAMPFGSGHVPGSVNIGLGGQFASWAGSVLGLDRQIILVADDEREAEESRTRLARVGIERVDGVVDGGIAGWARAGLPLAQTDQITVQDLRERMPEFCVVDVRRPGEWNGDGRIPGATLRPLDRLGTSMGDLPRDRPLAVHCKSGYRSSIACSLLQAGGFERVMNVQGGFDAWVRAGFPVEK
ncbi:MAG TPA: rhodanese-like domain-containing protein [Bryobacteraceae bacterium]|jgi:glyoxylase-like metal-dependent hydrolase (beta-lactamase superfamily II)/rhodanese-related sulfurtransferase